MLKLYQADIRPLFSEAVFEEQLKQVNEQRRAKVLRCKRKEDKCRSLAAGLLLRYGLLQEGIDYDKAEFGKNAHGKPMLVSAVPTEQPLCFSLSHAGDYAVAAFSHQEVGVDVEKCRMRFDGEEGQVHMMRIAEKSFTQREQERLKRLSGKERIMEFTGIWTKKESYAKAAGCGLQMDFSDIDTDHDGCYHGITIEQQYCVSVCTFTEEQEPGLFPITIG